MKRAQHVHGHFEKSPEDYIRLFNAKGFYFKQGGTRSCTSILYIRMSRWVWNLHPRFKPLFSPKKTRSIVLRNEPERFNFVSMKMDPRNQEQLIARLQKAWKTVDPIHPMKYEFYEHQLEDSNQVVFDLAAVIGFFAFLTITIACLGLLGMAIYTSERRAKEIGIRKVLGADGVVLIYVLSKEFLILLCVAVIIAAPLSYYVNNLWLNFLVVKVTFGFGTLILGSSFILLLGFLTIAPQTFRVSNRNPVESLRTE